MGSCSVGSNWCQASLGWGWMVVAGGEEGLDTMWAHGLSVQVVRSQL